MSKRLYVGNLNYATTDDDLNDLFSEAGTVVSAVVIRDRETDRSKGFGFVEMETDEGAQQAIEMFHDYEFQRRPLTVNEARPKKDRRDGPRGGFSRGGDRGRGGGDRYRGGDY